MSPPIDLVQCAAVPANGPAFSLLRLSAAARLGGALVLIAGLWATVLWALA